MALRKSAAVAAISFALIGISRRLQPSNTRGAKSYVDDEASSGLWSNSFTGLGPGPGPSSSSQAESATASAAKPAVERKSKTSVCDEDEEEKYGPTIHRLMKESLTPNAAQAEEAKRTICEAIQRIREAERKAGLDTPPIPYGAAREVVKTQASYLNALMMDMDERHKWQAEAALKEAEELGLYVVESTDVVARNQQLDEEAQEGAAAEKESVAREWGERRHRKGRAAEAEEDADAHAAQDDQDWDLVESADVLAHNPQLDTDEQAAVEPENIAEDEEADAAEDAKAARESRTDIKDKEVGSYLPDNVQDTKVDDRNMWPPLNDELIDPLLTGVPDYWANLNLE